MSKLLTPTAAAALCAAAFLNPSFATAQNYTMSILTSDGSVTATETDTNLVNPWGIARSSGGPWWISDNATGKTTVYNGDGTTQSLVVTIPSNSTGTGSPSGTVYNGTTSFQVSANAPAIFLFATEDGSISGWNPGYNQSAAAIRVSNGGAVYKGLAMAWFDNAPYLYVPNFNSGQIEVYDGTFNPVTMDPQAFQCDAQKRGLAPFNVQNIGGTIWVTFAKQDDAKHDNVNGDGLGYVAAFTPQGRLLRHMQTGPFLNAPWGIALAPSDFGSFSHDLLIGNFGSGQIAAFNPNSGKFEGLVTDANNNPIAIDGLWGLSFGGATSNSGNFNTLYFTAGPNHETGGVLGTLVPVSADLTQGSGQ